VRGVSRQARGVVVRDLDRVLRAFFEAGRHDIQGSLGQLQAALTLIERHGATEIRFEEVARELGVQRNFDIVATTPGGRLRVEVKTNLTGAASFDVWEIQRDLLLHAQTGYSDLLYLYHPGSAGELPRLGERMLGLFDTPRVRELFRTNNLDLAAAREAFRGWLSRGGLGTY
jgi:hypothetical protein